MKIKLIILFAGPGGAAPQHRARPGLQGNHLSNTTCLAQAFFKSGEDCSELR